MDTRGKNDPLTQVDPFEIPESQVPIVVQGLLDRIRSLERRLERKEAQIHRLHKIMMGTLGPEDF